MSTTLANNASGQDVLDKKISLSIDKQGIKSILTQIEKKAEVKFAYLSQTIPFENKRISLKVDNEKLGDLLLQILKPFDLSFEVSGTQIILHRVPANGPAATNTPDARFKKISGIVHSSKDGAAVEGASVMVKNSGKGVSTNAEGRFSIDAVEGDVLVISAVGYLPVEVTVGASTVYTVQLQPGSKDLGEVVVTALGISKQKRQLGFSITEVKGSELAQTNEVNPINALQGRVAGVQIDQGAGGLFGSTKILIRGNSTLGSNNQPIFIIDGVIMDNDASVAGAPDFGNDLKNLNMDDFESVSVLKGSAAAALYGTQAINGAVLITTKKGAARKGIGVSLNQTLNLQDPYKGPQFQNQYGGGSVGAFFTDTRDPNYLPTQNFITQVFPTNPITGLPYIDAGINRELENWGPRMLGQKVTNYDGTPTTYSPQPNNFLQSFQKGKGTNTNVALEGGTEKSTFRFSYNHNQATGITFTNKFTKDAFDFRGTHTFNKFISADLTAAYSNFNGQNPPVFGNAFMWLLPRNYNTDYWKQPAHYTSIFGGVPDPTNPNEPNKVPLASQWFNLFNNVNSQDQQLVRGRLALTMNLTSWAKLVLDGSLNNIYTKNENKQLGTGINYMGGSYYLGFQNKTTHFLSAMLMVNKGLNKDLDLNGYVGVSQQRRQTTYENSTTNGGLLYPGNYFLGNSASPVTTNAGISDNFKLNSALASADLAYRNRLFLQATYRADWNSALTYSNGTGNNVYQYPSLSLSWIFTESLRHPDWLSYGKLRGNLAFLGGGTDPFRINPGFGFNQFSYANGGTAPMSTFTTDPTTGAISVLQKNLKPQNKFSRELGLEMRFLKSRLGMDVSLYQDNTKNQLLPIGVPLESGVNSLFINAGNIQNRGIELAIDATPVKTGRFMWTTMFTFSKNQNKIISLTPGITEFQLTGAGIGPGNNDVSSWAVVGGAYGQLRSQTHSAAYQAKDGNGNNISSPNNGLPILAWRSDARAAFPARSNTWQTVGDINAKWRGGFNNTFTYKSFTLNVLIDAKIGGDFAALTYRYGTHTGVLPNTVAGRDAQTGGISWTSAFDGQNYSDGRIVSGVFAPGQTITQANGTVVDVGGMSFEDAYKAGYVEPTHTPQFFYRYGSSSTAVSDYWIFKNTWIALRQVALSYSLQRSIYQKLKLNGLSVSLIGRDLLYLYKTLPYDFNPADNGASNTAYSGSITNLPMTRNISFSIKAAF